MQEQLVKDDLEIIPHGCGWLIIHSRSNKYLDWFAIHWRAVEAKKELEQLGDWSSSESIIKRFGKRKIKAVLDKWQF